MKCVICNKTKNKWYVCKTCSKVLKKKYPKYNDFVRAIKEHKKARRL